MQIIKTAWLAFLAVALVTRGDDRALKEVDEILNYITEIRQLIAQESVPVEADVLSPEGDAIEALCNAIVQAPPKTNSNFDDVMRKTLFVWNYCLAEWNSKVSYAEWDYATNLTTANEKKLETVQTQATEWGSFLKRAAQDYKKDIRYGSLDSDTRRQIRLLAFGTDSDDPENVKKLVRVRSRLEKTYSTATVAKLSLEPDIANIMREQRDPDLLLAVWFRWREATGPKMKDDYEKMVELLNIGATENGFSSYAEAWLQEQFDETDNLESLAEASWKELEPLYRELHAYVREKLRAVYTGRAAKDREGQKDDKGKFYDELEDIFESGAIPAHLTGNMWAQSWQNIYDLVKPYDLPEVDYDSKLVQRGYDVQRLFSTAEAFYASIGLYNMTEKFKLYSMKEKPKDGRKVVCHASASDFSTADDFRIKMCTEVTMEYFETIHHEMGHIEYFMAYSDQPTVYRNGANSAFHEAIGDTISLSVLTRQHLRALGLAGEETTPAGEDGEAAAVGGGMSLDDKRAINYLMEKALFKVAFLPFGYMIDKWRWDVFRKKITKENYNRHWWELRLKYQGIVAPVPRSEQDFDPGAKFHIPSNSPYICYFFSFIIQFQFYEAMCGASGHQGELYDCDFFRSKEAGGKLLDMLKLGRSVPWPDAMEVLTGTREMSTGSILRYFRPLYDWLKRENKKLRAKVGWEDARVNWMD